MKKTNKKLALKRETVRQLGDVQLTKVVGGATGFCDSNFTCLMSGCFSLTCFTQCQGCSIYPTCTCGNG